MGNMYELIFELAALFCYEFPLNPLDNYKYFVRERPLFTSELAKSLEDSAALQEMRVACLSISHYTQGDLSQMLEHQMKRFPHSIFFVRAYLSVTYGLKQHIFLCRNPGEDPLTRLIRDCALLYREQKELITSLEKSTKAEGEARRAQEETAGEDAENPNGQIGEMRELPLNDREKKRMMSYWVRVVRKIAEAHSGNLLLDDYFWCNLMFNMGTGKREHSHAVIDEVVGEGIR